MSDPDVRTETVIVVVFVRGDGLKTIAREVRKVCALDGTFIAEHDPYPGELANVDHPVHNGAFR